MPQHVFPLIPHDLIRDQVFAPRNPARPSPLYAKGDLLVHGAALNRIAVGTDGQVLTADSTQALGVKWAASGSSVTPVKKTASTTRTNNTLSDDPHLTIALAASTAYFIRVVLPFTIANATMDFKYRLNYTGTITAQSVTRAQMIAGTAGSTDNQSTNTTNTGVNSDITMVGTGSGDGVAIAEIALHTNGSGTFSVQWAQNTTDAGNCTVYAGASMLVFA